MMWQTPRTTKQGQLIEFNENVSEKPAKTAAKRDISRFHSTKLTGMFFWQADGNSVNRKTCFFAMCVFFCVCVDNDPVHHMAERQLHLCICFPVPVPIQVHESRLSRAETRDYYNNISYCYTMISNSLHLFRRWCKGQWHIILYVNRHGWSSI